MSENPIEMTTEELRAALALSEQVRKSLTAQVGMLETGLNYWKKACKQARRELKQLTQQPKNVVQ